MQLNLLKNEDECSFNVRLTNGDYVLFEQAITDDDVTKLKNILTKISFKSVTNIGAHKLAQAENEGYLVLHKPLEPEVLLRYCRAG